MKDLIEEFFKRDLTEAEKDQLTELINGSDEDALRFARMAENFYAKTGLPQPRWSGKPLKSRRVHKAWFTTPTFFFLPVLAFAIVGGVTAVKAVHHWLAQRQSSPTPVETPQPLTATPTPEVHALPAAVSKPVEPQATSTPVFTPVPTATLSPIPTPAGPKKQELSVVVGLHQSGVVTVRVLDQGNNEIRLLGTNILPAGQQTFTWDGLKQNGQLAPPGTYYVEVKSSAGTLRKKIKIEPPENP